MNGIVNGNLGVIKSVIAELTDESNVARGFTLMPMARAVGYIIGFVGRVYCCRDVVIDVLRTRVLQPFHRRCFITSARSMARPVLAPILGRVPVLSSMSCGRCLCAPIAHIEYTISRRGNAYTATLVAPSLIFQKTLDFPPRSDLVHQRSRDTPPKDTKVRAIVPAKAEEPLPLHMLLTKPVMISIANYAMLALLDMSAMVLIPLVWSTPIELGGLNLSPASIGLWLSAYGCLNGVLQFFLFPSVVGRLGPGRVVLASIVAYVIIYTMFSFENLAARHAISAHGAGMNAAVWLFVILQLASICITDMGFSEFLGK